MNGRRIAGWCLALGIGLVLLSVGWPKLLPSSMSWDDARARELSNASESLHDTMHAQGKKHDHAHLGHTHADDDPKVVAAAERYRKSRSELDSARFWSQSVAKYLRWSGLSVCLVGVIAYFASRDW